MHWVTGLGGGICCACIWRLLDSYIGEVGDAHFYIAVACAYAAGTGLPFARVKSK